MRKHYSPPFLSFRLSLILFFLCPPFNALSLIFVRFIFRFFSFFLSPLFLVLYPFYTPFVLLCPLFCTRFLTISSALMF
ncbi:hypothetical protein BKA57DRAFT_452777 [Linnemannia elongata]|nr:hypothetical protein BKA57DRAFT_470939 [Linnemannia elongata]KAH7053920.1 hypothetical protein BKA57DRAFT_454837 [Linnemannia elongata]KAH7055014.1 hypothetical protein BKA57DRAFT_452777 [Linnemannia elongata]